MNNCLLIGRCSKDIELRFIPSSGMAVAKFSLAVDREMSKDKKQEAAAQGKPTADFINITAFGKTAESCANYLSKGNRCAVQGRISTGSYTTQTGEKRYTTEVIADKVEFLEPKERQAKPQESFDDFPDVFEPVDDFSDIPF